jgi:hypothetical protein
MNIQRNNAAYQTSRKDEKMPPEQASKWSIGKNPSKQTPNVLAF